MSDSKLRADVAGKPDIVDRKANVIRGYVVAQAGPFKSAGRGEFDHKSLRLIWRQMKANDASYGTKSRFTHPSLSGDGLGKLLGRAKNPRMGTAINAAGDEVEAVRADLHLAPSSFATPHGNLGGYVMQLAEDDPAAFSSSLVLSTDEEWRLDSKGRKVLGDDGEPLPPLWRPKQISASDVVDTGDAVDGFLGKQLSIEGMPDELARKAWPLAQDAFAGLSKSEILRRLSGWAERIADLIGVDDAEDPEAVELRKRTLRLIKLRQAILTSGG